MAKFGVDTRGCDVLVINDVIINDVIKGKVFSVVRRSTLIADNMR